MDLSTFTSTTESGEWMTLVHPITGEELNMRIKVISPDSKIIRDAKCDLANRRLRKKHTVTAESIQDDGDFLLMKTIIDWEGFELNKEPLECTFENIQMVFGNPNWSWIKKQVDDFISDDVNFIKVSKN